MTQESIQDELAKLDAQIAQLMQEREAKLREFDALRAAEQRRHLEEEQSEAARRGTRAWVKATF
jgi:hypothetical protein